MSKYSSTVHPVEINESVKSADDSSNSGDEDDYDFNESEFDFGDINFNDNHSQITDYITEDQATCAPLFFQHLIYVYVKLKSTLDTQKLKGYVRWILDFAECRITV